MENINLDNHPMKVTIRKYLGQPNSIVNEEKIAMLSPKNPVSEVKTNVITINNSRQLYDENEQISCAVDPTNLTAPLKVNNKLKQRGTYVPVSLSQKKEDPAYKTIQELRALKSSYYETKTNPQNKHNFIPDLIYHDELDRIDSMHNAMVHPNSFVPPPTSVNPEKDMTHQSLTNGNYYPVTDNFFSKDQFK